MPSLSDLAPRPESVACLVGALYSCGRIEADVAVGREAWMLDSARQDSVTYRLLLLGESLKRFLALHEGKPQPGGAKKRENRKNRDSRFLALSDDDYKLLIRLRDKLAHLTVGHDHSLIWDLATKQVPRIAAALSKGAHWVTPNWLNKPSKTKEEEYVAKIANEWLAAEMKAMLQSLTEAIKPNFDQITAAHTALAKSLADSVKLQTDALTSSIREHSLRQAQDVARIMARSWPPPAPSEDQ